MAELGAVVSRIRKEKGLSRDEVERRSGKKILQSWLAHFEAGRIKHPGPSKMKALAQALNVTVFYLYKEAGVIESDAPKDADSTEIALVKVFRSLPPADRNLAMRIVTDLATAKSVEQVASPKKQKLARRL